MGPPYVRTYATVPLIAYPDKTPEERARLLETTPLFGQIHASAASSGQSSVRPQDLDTDLHFTCFVKAPATRPANDPITRWRLIELDGGRIGPIDRGECSDLLKACTPLIPFFLETSILTQHTGYGEIRQGILCIASQEYQLQHDGTLPWTRR